LQTVDELVDGVVTRLSQSGILDKTYIICTSDNGYHIGQHRLQPGKECGFEEDIRVPLFIRGPGVPADHIESTVTTHVDLVPTLFQIAGIRQRDDFDGTPIPLTVEDGRSQHEHVNVEFWGLAIPEGEYNSLGMYILLFHSEPSGKTIAFITAHESGNQDPTTQVSSQTTHTKRSELSETITICTTLFGAVAITSSTT
jgi:hypothetical protein